MTRNILLSLFAASTIVGCDGCGNGTIRDDIVRCTDAEAVCTDGGAPGSLVENVGTEDVQEGGRQTYPRDHREWQGMLVDSLVEIECRKSEDCGLALACRDGQCAPCVVDSHCSPGESCVLDHCVTTENVACTTYADCGDALCVLSGYSATPRGNDGMRAFCRGSSGGSN